MKKIIIDTDPGVDDAIAIAFGIKANLVISGICTTYGNSTVANCTRNALMIMELMDSDVPIYEGSSQPMLGVGQLAESHGENGLGDFLIQTKRKVNPSTASEYYQKILTQSPDKSITIIAIGPVTNLGKIALQSPQLLRKIDQIIIMGGVFEQKGNVTPFAEFNIYNDPVAFERVLQAGLQNITLVPANVCREVTFQREIFIQLTDKKLATGLSKISELFINYYTGQSEYGQFDGGVMYDLLALAFAVESSLFTTTQTKVVVETTDLNRYGETKIVAGQPNCNVVTKVNKDALKKLYIEVMNGEYVSKK